MSRFSGPQFKGANKQFKLARRVENQECEQKWREWDVARNAQAAQGEVDVQAWEAFIRGDTDEMPKSKMVVRSIFGDVDLETGNITYMGGTLVAGLDF